ncbi:uncharacterized protein C13orf46 homolog isoform X2 [Monodelphis domestica]|uniref:uncharacterized protein C13orf46 homolog isoform X2 n=1 Tax=Monodelphis domestica TaxID=13616 RepID=UPI000443603C|nr:uncharacterized protein C13orf46 homolog isoform X2 [Monodelphis domestica]
MEKEAVYRRHRLVPGSPPSVTAPGLYKAVTEASELQRRKSIGGFPPKGDSGAPIEKLLQEFGEDLEKESKGEAEGISCQIILEDEKDDQNQGDLKRLDQDKDIVKDKDKEKIEQESEKKEEGKQIKEEQDEEKKDREKENYALELDTTQSLGKGLESLKIDDILLNSETHLMKPPVAFVEIDLEERVEEIKDHVDMLFSCLIQEEVKRKSIVTSLEGKEEKMSSTLASLPAHLQRIQKSLNLYQLVIRNCYTEF